LNRAVHIGLAAATEQGLVVPVIRNADQKSLLEIAGEREKLTASARVNRLLPDDVSGGTFTLTNLGMYRIDAFQAILNPPQSAILAVGRIRERPFAWGGLLGVRPTCILTLSCDHRVLDGLAGAAFLQRCLELIEAPTGLG
jgi:pyruvate dehydrogenase E2 component (dihydrolipoamide acetyltransferase)